MPPINLPTPDPDFIACTIADVRAGNAPLHLVNVSAILILSRPPIKTVHRGMGDLSDRRSAEAQDGSAEESVSAGVIAPAGNE